MTATFWSAAVLEALDFLKWPPSPVVRQPNHFAWFFKFHEQSAHGSCLPWQDQFWPDVGQRLKYKFPQMRPWVRQLQSFVSDVPIAAVEQVDVDATRHVFPMIAIA